MLFSYKSINFIIKKYFKDKYLVSIISDIFLEIYS